jgi:DNA sulfur modification protein DndD
VGWLSAVVAPLLLIPVGFVLVAITPVHRLFLAAVAVGLSGSLAFLLRRRIADWANVQRTRLFAELSETFHSQSGSELGAAGYDELPSALARVQAGAESAQQLLTKSRSDLDSLQVQIAGLATRLEEAEVQLDKTDDELGAWLRHRGAASREDYRRRRGLYLQVQREHHDVEGQVLAAMERLGCTTEEALRAQISLRVHNLEAEITHREVPEDEVRVLQRERSRIDQQVRELREEDSRRRRSVDEERGAVRATLGDLPQRILECEKDLTRCRKTLSSLARDRRAAALAEKLFRRLADDSTIVLQRLAEDVSDAYGAVMGLPSVVMLPTMDPQLAAVPDASGETRSLLSLSTGTRDAFLLAVKLTLAERSMDGEALILLDEPFHSFDTERTRHALELLQAFQQRTGWQIILLTKDKALAESCGTIFPEVVVHELTRASDQEEKGL